MLRPPSYFRSLVRFSEARMLKLELRLDRQKKRAENQGSAHSGKPGLHCFSAHDGETG